MTNRDILAIGTSAGGVEALMVLVRQFKVDIPAAIFITLHLPSHLRSSLDQVLSYAGGPPVAFARHGEEIRRGQIYLAPVDRHLMVDQDRIWLGQGARENNARPAIDPMLRSIAACCGHRAVGVVLTGALSDGASGLWAIQQSGGITVVQEPSDAAFPDMPTNALKRIQPDYIVSLAEMPATLLKLVEQPSGEPMPIRPNVGIEVEMAKGGHSTIEDMDRVGRRSGFACPDCHGAMWEIDEDELVRFRCHVGHTYTDEMMSIALDENLRRSLGSAIRVLEERRGLARNLEMQAEKNGRHALAASWAERADEFQRELEIIRDSVDRVDRISAAWRNKIAAE
jgi:two-component system chemotaxis response regulator CheB